MKEQIIEILYDSLNEFARNLTKYDYNKTAEKILNLLTEDGYKKMTNTWCAYCGKEFPLDTVTAEQVGEHIATCEKHPLFLANKRIKELEKALDQAGSKLDEQVIYYGDVIASKNDRIAELDEEICLEVCGSCTQEEIWKDKDCKICHRNMLEALKIVKRFTWCDYCGINGVLGCDSCEYD